MNKHLALLLIAACLLPCAACLSLRAAPKDDAWEALRRQILDRPREVFYNTDGDDAICFGRPGHTKEATPENFKAERLNYCLGTETTTVSYCLANGIGWLHYDSKVGQPLVKNVYETLKGGRNIVGELIAQGTDPMRLTLEFCREHNLECFACLRMNDTHDGGHTAAKPYVHWSPFKEAHPDALFGSEQHRTPYCTWTAVDFNHPAVQKYYPAVVEEICGRYDVDGFEYDFMRHAQLFRSVANGGKASEAELEAMTALMRRLRAVTEAAGHAKGRPIMVAVRVPDSVEYCRAIGIDIEKWLSERLIDILVTTSYFQLNQWNYTVALAHKYGAKAYASMDESRIRTPHLPLGTRNSLPSYQGQIMAAMQQGMDGVYIFNMEYAGLTPRAFAKPETLKFKDKLYYATYRGSGGYQAGGYLRNGECYGNMLSVEPGQPASVASNGSLDIPIYIGDDLQDAAVKARHPNVTAQLRSSAGCAFRLAVNGVPVPQEGRTTADGVSTYDIPAALVRCGENRFTVSPVGAEGGFKRIVAVKGDALLTGSLRGRWRRFYMDEKDSESIVDGAYQLKDARADGQIGASLWHPLFSKGAPLKVKVTVKLVQATDDDSAVLRIADGVHVEKVVFREGRVALACAGKSVPFDTTGDFHRYEVDFADGVVTLQADGKVLLSAPLTAEAGDSEYDMVGTAAFANGMNSNGVAIGSISCPGQGTMLFKDFEVLQDSISVEDFAVAVSIPDEVPAALLALRDAAIVPLAAVAVKEGAVVPTEGVDTRYRKGCIVKDNEAVLLLHRNGFDYFDLKPCLPLDSPPRFLLAEFTVRTLADGSKGEPAFSFFLAPARPGRDDQVWELQLDISARSVRSECLKGRINLAGIDLGQDNTYRVAMDTVDGVAAVWCNGILIHAGQILRGARRKTPIAFVGDGSGNIDGLVRFGGVVVGVPK